VNRRCGKQHDDAADRFSLIPAFKFCFQFPPTNMCCGVNNRTVMDKLSKVIMDLNQPKFINQRQESLNPPAAAWYYWY
jgi:hypothetical protein